MALSISLAGGCGGDGGVAEPSLPPGVIVTVAGGLEGGFGGDGGPAAEALLASPDGVAIDKVGTLYIADRNNNRIRRVDGSGMITTVAGGGPEGPGQGGFGGDGGPAIEAPLDFPGDVAVEVIGNLYIADTFNNRVRRVDRAGIITTLAGTGATEGPGSFGGDGRQATIARLDRPRAVAVDVHGNVYIADTGNHRVRRVDFGGTITTVAGMGEPGFSGDGGLATRARLSSPSGLALDETGNLYIADTGNHRVRMVDGRGFITTVAGSGPTGPRAGDFAGDGGPATAARLNQPRDVAVGQDGSLYVADWANMRVRRVASDGVIETVAGNGSSLVSGDRGPAVDAGIGLSRGLAFRPTEGALYIGAAHSLRKVVVGP